MYWTFMAIELVVLVAAWPVPIWLLSRHDRPRPGRVRRARRGLDRRALDFLHRGHDGAVDATLTELVERGAVLAEAGVLALRSHATARHDPDPLVRAVADAVLEVGRGGRNAVRDHLRDQPGLSDGIRRLLERRRLLVTPARRVLRVVVHGVVATVAAAVPAVGSSLASWVPTDAVSVVMHVVLMVGWTLPPALVCVLERPGLRQRTVLGSACLTAPA